MLESDGRSQSSREQIRNNRREKFSTPFSHEQTRSARGDDEQRLSDTVGEHVDRGIDTSIVERGKKDRAQGDESIGNGRRETLEKRRLAPSEGAAQATHESRTSHRG